MTGYFSCGNTSTRLVNRKYDRVPSFIQESGAQGSFIDMDDVIEKRVDKYLATMLL